MRVVMRVKSPTAEVHFEASEAPTVIGRSSQANLKIPDDNCSRAHCRITSIDEELWLEDLGSKNGTFVNGIKIQKIRIYLKDKILIGDTEMNISREKNSPAVLASLEYTGSTSSRNRRGLQLDEKDMTQVRLNPLTAIKSPAITQRSPHKSTFQDASPPPLSDEMIVPPIRRKIATALDTLLLLGALALPAMLSSKDKGLFFDVPKEGIGGKEIAILVVLSLIVGLIFWVINNRRGRRSIGERIVGIPESHTSN